VTDGDVRRALLAGARLDDPVGPHRAVRFTAVGPSDTRESVLDLMQARSISQVPVLNPDGTVAGLHVLRELVGRTDRSNHALILAGGRGTRLLPLTERVPKPMVRVAGRPILERLLLHVVGAGISSVHLSVNYLADVIERHFGEGERFGCTISYLREETAVPLGTGGPLLLLPDEAWSAPVLVLNGDLVTQFDVAALLDDHVASGSLVTIGTNRHRYQVPFGVLGMEEDGLVRRLDEKPVLEWAVNGGVYVVERDLLDSAERNQDLPLTDLITRALDRGQKVSTHILEGDWADVGTPLQLSRARGEL